MTLRLRHGPRYEDQGYIFAHGDGASEGRPSR